MTSPPLLPRPPALLVIAVLAAAVFGGVAWYMRHLESEALGAAAVRESLDDSGRLREIVQLRDSVRAMKLVTVEVRTSVTATVTDDSWRGGVTASATAPVTLSYGTNLSGLEEGAIRLSPLGTSYSIRVPRPHRIATQLGTESETKVDVGWLRFRSVAGEYYLGQARKRLAEEAEKLVLSPRDAEEVARATKEQIATLVRAVLGRDVDVHVVFEDKRQ